MFTSLLNALRLICMIYNCVIPAKPYKHAYELILMSFKAYYPLIDIHFSPFN